MRYYSAAPVARPLAALVALAVLAVATPTLAQRYKSDQIDGRLSSKGVIASRYLKTGQGDAQEFKDYIEKYYFPAMTQATPDGLADLEKLQTDLFKKFLYPAPAATQKYLHEKAMDFTMRVLKDRAYHPSVRYNALLLLGKLDDKYPAGNAEPVPSAKATDLLCSIAGNSVKSSNLPNYLLVGSLIGLERHAMYIRGLPRAQQAKLQKTLYDVLTVEKLEGEFSPEVRDWVFTRAATAIAAMETTGPKSVFALAMAKRVSDESLSLEARAAIAAQLGRLKAEAGDAAGAPVAKALLDLASDIGKEEAEIAGKFEDMQILPGATFVGARGKLSRRITVGEEREPKLIREGILALFSDLREGLRTAKKIAPENQQPTMASIDDAVAEVVRVTADKGNIDLDVTEAIRQMAAVVEEANAQPLAATE